MIRRMRWALWLLATLFYTCCLAASSLSISPKSPTIPLGSTQQFTASGSAAAGGVTWYAGGVKGGNATAGTISATGLYTAPAAMPAQAPVQITAKSVSSSTVKASVYVNLLMPGPTITEVDPNPLPAGTTEVTIQGQGFQAGATVQMTAGSQGEIQLATDTQTANTITASAYLADSTTSASFCVTNPGSTCSNVIVVPVVAAGGGGGTSTYNLTVVNGTGSGSYAAGSTVTITANAAPAGQSFANWSGATVANATAPTTTLTMPAADTTVTANFSGTGPTSYSLTVVNGMGSGSYAAGTVVPISANTPPAGQTFQSWTGATVANSNSANTTLTMPAAAATVTASFGATPVSIPYPVASHPRLWITQADLPKLQSWATSSNPVYQQGMVPLLAQAVTYYTTYYFPNGVANPTYPDNGDSQGYGTYTPSGTWVPISEQLGAIFAFNSLIDPDPSKRVLYAQYAHNLLMYAINQAALGHAANLPFRDPGFAVYNRANGSGEQWGLIVDWLYNQTDGSGNPILSAAEKTTIRNVFMMWANDCLSASTTGGDHPEPIGITNSLQLLPNNLPYRMAANNYYLGHARLLTMMALAIDPADDQPVNPAAPVSQLGNSLRSYLLDVNGAWLYQEYAMYGEPAAVASAYGIGGSGAGLGIASGGLPPEGMLYGHSYGFVLAQLLSLQTAGFNNPSYTGPQIALIGSPMWDRYVTGFMSSLAPTPYTDPTQTYLGPVYRFASYGDVLRLWVEPDTMDSFSLLALLEAKNGNTSHLNAARWFALNATEGGADYFYSRIASPWAYGTTNSLLYYLLFDPTAPAPTDPRPSFPTTFFDPAAGRVVAHSDWTASGSMFTYRASWESINHQLGDGGLFELLRNGEWLTKELSNYDNNDQGLTTPYHNTLAIQNWSAAGTPSLGWYETPEWTNGSQWILASNAGDPTTVMSRGGNYLYVASDLTKLYNRLDIWAPDQGATDVQQATRAVVWLNKDYVVIYDRATTLHPGLFKFFDMSMATNPVIQGQTAKETLVSGQQLFVQTLLPAKANLVAFNGAANLNPVAMMEPMQYILTVQDPTLPTDTRFLHVLQGADPGAAMVPATYLQSSGGTPFDGAAFGANVVYFPVSASAAFTGTQLPAPAGASALTLTGLVPGASYIVTATPTSTGSLINVTPGTSGTTADSAGVLTTNF